MTQKCHLLQCMVHTNNHAPPLKHTQNLISGLRPLCSSCKNISNVAAKKMGLAHKVKQNLKKQTNKSFSRIVIEYHSWSSKILHLFNDVLQLSCYIRRGPSTNLIPSPLVPPSENGLVDKVKFLGPIPNM